MHVRLQPFPHNPGTWVCGRVCILNNCKDATATRKFPSDIVPCRYNRTDLWDLFIDSVPLNANVRQITVVVPSPLDAGPQTPLWATTCGPFVSDSGI